MLGIPAVSAVEPQIKTDRAAIEALVAAELAEYDGDARRALAEWQRLAVLIPDLPDIQETMLRQAIDAGDYVSAQNHASILWNISKYSIDARVVLITSALQRRDWTSADRLTTEALDDPQKKEWERMFAPIIRGWVAVGRKDRTGVAAAMPDDSHIVHPSMRGHEGLMLLALGDKRGAQQVAAALRPTDRISQLAAAQLVVELTEAGLADAATDLRSRVRILDQASNEPMLLLPARRVKTPAQGVASWFAPMAASFSRISETPSPFGETLARSALALDPENWEARLMLVEDLRSLSRFDDAIRLLGNKGQVPPFVRLVRAEILLEMGDAKAASWEADSAVTGQNVSRSLLIMHTDFVRKLGDKVRSEAAFTRLLANLSATGDEPVLEALIMVSLADLRLKDQPWADVIPLISRAVELAPNDASVLNFAGYSAIERRKDLSQSLEMISKAADLDPSNASIIDSLGWAYHLLGQHEKAVPLLEQAWRGQSSNAVIAEHLGDAYWIVGRQFEARYMWRAADLIAEGEMKTRLDAKIVHGLTAETAAP